MSETKPFILCTAVIDESLLRWAASKKILIDVMPFIKTEAVSTIEVHQEIEHASTLSATVVFTSVNAVKAVAAGLEGLQPDWRIFCVGQSTSQLAKDHFGKESVVGTADTARHLADLIIDETHIDELIFFTGDQRRNELPDILSRNGVYVSEIIVYETIATPQKLERNYDAILFFSPSAVKSFFRLNQINEQVILFAIGETTGNEIKGFSKNKLVIADNPEKKVLLENAVTYFDSNRIHK